MGLFLKDVVIVCLALPCIVFVHECGHFFAARAFRVPVTHFSIGRGPVLWCWRTARGTECTLRWFLFGGYVRMAIPKPSPCAAKGRRCSLPLWQQAVLVLSGPLANLFLGVLAFFILHCLAYPVYQSVILGVLPRSPAAISHLQPGFTCLSVNRKPVNTWEAFTAHLHAAQKLQPCTVALTGRYAGSPSIQSIYLRLPAKSSEDTDSKEGDILLRRLGIYGNTLLRYQPSIRQIQPGSAADIAGLRRGDVICAIQGIQTEFGDAALYILENESQFDPFRVCVQRSVRSQERPSRGRSVKLKLLLQPSERLKKDGTTGGETGIRFEPLKACPYVQWHRESVWAAGLNAFRETGYCIGRLFQIAKQVVAPRPVPLGPGRVPERHEGGLYYGLRQVGLFSIILAIVNLAPIPHMDGGQLCAIVYRTLQKDG